MVWPSKKIIFFSILMGSCMGSGLLLTLIKRLPLVAFCVNNAKKCP